MDFKLKHVMCLPVLSMVIWTLTSSCIQPASSARILAVETVGGKSHWNFMSGILRALVNRGHNVTVFTPFPDGNHENYTEVDISKEHFKFLDMDIKDMRINILTVMDLLVETSRMQCDLVYENSKMKEVLDSKNTDFDLIIIENFASDCVSYIATKLNLPLIYVTPMPTIGLMGRSSTGHILNPSTDTHIFFLHAIPKTFIQRLTNMCLSTYFKIAQEYKELVLKYTDPKKYDFIKLISPSLIFVNRHFITDAPTSKPTNVINIGGIHLKAAQKLPEDILEFIEQSPHGVVYFTFGSTIKMSSIPEEIKKALLEVLAQIPQRVLWKYENDLEDIPKNVMVRKWLPQRDILCNILSNKCAILTNEVTPEGFFVVHPNVKLFISHGGISGVYETLDAGVPVLGFPVSGDQPRNLDNLVNAGMAISMDLLSITKDSFLRNVLGLLNNKKYKENAEIASKIFKDRPMSLEESAVYWTEYVLRHKGAPHLKSHALNLRWYEYYSLDVLVLVIIFISVVIYITRIIFKSIYNMYCLNFSKYYKSKPE